jgi:DNA helicase-2/ATP-dependent DNA helicase PcrA
MTIHAAKGLEFPNVFIVGMEENLFPSQMSVDNPRAVEEERRLFYVALTRAEENCILTYAKSRFRNGQTQMSAPSRFLRDIDEEYLNLPAEWPKKGASGSIYSRSEYERPAPPASPQSVYPRLIKPEAAPVNRPAVPAATADVSGNTSSLRVGSRISHDRFGEGVITALEGDGANTKASVSFLHSGDKTLILKYARIQVLD